MFVVTLKPTEPIYDPVTKFGGQPVWLSAPQWPLGKTDGKPMRFICQVQLPQAIRCGGQEMAYIFMTDSVGGESWAPEKGDNAVILQPAPFNPHVEVSATSSGPTLQMMKPGVTGNRLVPVDCEYRAELLELADE